MFTTLSPPPKKQKNRYRDVGFLKAQRRWPPGLVDAMAAFLRLESVGGGAARAAAAAV
jgi:hypothetical protein